MFQWSDTATTSSGGTCISGLSKSLLISECDLRNDSDWPYVSANLVIQMLLFSCRVSWQCPEGRESQALWLENVLWYMSTIPKTCRLPNVVQFRYIQECLKLFLSRHFDPCIIGLGLCYQSADQFSLPQVINYMLLAVTSLVGCHFG